MITVKKIIQGVAVGVPAIILVSLALNAADNRGNISESLVGRMVIGEREGVCPEEMSFVETESGGFCIDIYEASPGEDCPYISISNQLNTRENLDEPECKPVSAANAVPWRFVSQSQAMVACSKAGKRLPSDSEWYLASLGTPDLETGWGKDDCNVANNRENQPGLTGAGKKCVSSIGAYDMIGNVWEWVRGEVRNGTYNGNEMPGSGFIKAVDINGLPIETDRESPDPNYNEDYFWIKKKGVRGIVRGGYWDNKSEAGLYSVYLDSPPSFAVTGVGFRCAK